MLELRYTGAKTSSETQYSPSKSIGGYVSTSKIPNDDFNNIFSEISILAKQNKKREARLIALKNITSSNVEDVIIAFSFTSSDVTYRYGFVDPNSDTNGEYFEKLNSGQELPTYATLNTIVSGQQIEVGAIDANSSIGLWLIRDLTTAFVTPLTCDQIEAQGTLSTEETLGISITFDESEPSVSVSASV